MGRYTKALCKLCRREKQKLYLKGSRCYTDKCAIESRNYPPGVHGQRPVKYSDYGIQLREKQKVKRIYGIYEKQFRRFFSISTKMSGIVGENLLQLCERRLDNVVYRTGFANNRRMARQFVNHGHIRVNGKKVDIASYIIKQNDIISFKENIGNKFKELISQNIENKNHKVPGWVEVNTENLSAEIKNLPARTDMDDVEINEQLIVELYSK